MTPSPAGGRPPHRIGPFRIERQLGQGGMGVVYLGRDEISGTLAAVKVIKPAAARDPVFQARLRREVAAARSIPRFCTAPVIAADLGADPAYVATEYIEAPTLAQRGRLAGAELSRLAVGVAVALRAIHDHGVIHRDLKPANILLSRVGPRVIDFGIARLHGADTQLTQVGEKLGTIPYMAPEQLDDGPITPALDIFAWAGVVTFAATGRPPFGADEATPFRILHSEPSLRGLAEPLRGLVKAAFHKDPARRPTASKLVNQLSRRAPAVTTEVLRTATVPARAGPEPDRTLHESDPHRTLHVPSPPGPTEREQPPADREQPRKPFVTRLSELLEQRRLVAAFRLVDAASEADIPADGVELAAWIRTLATRAFGLRDQAQVATDPDQAWRLLDEAEAYAADLPDLPQLRRRWPPHPPDTPRAQVTESEVVISWTPSRSQVGAVRYRVLRATRPFPADHATGGDKLAETTDCLVRDRTPPVNAPLYYAVVAERGGVAAPPAATGAPAWFRPEVSDLRITPGDQLVAAAWRTPPGAHRVLVRRAEGRAPRDAEDGSAVTPTGARFTDRDVRTGVAYHYLLSVSYLEPDGREVHTPGVRFTAVPARPPVPVRDLRLEALGDEPGWLRARFEPPPAGTVELRELDAPPDQPAGTRLPAAELPGAPVPAVPVPGGLKLAAPERPAILLAATVSGELAALGPHRQWRPLAAPTGLRARRHGEEVLLTWQWPADVGVMEVCWRALRADPPPDRAGWRCQRVTAARYRNEGGATLRPSGARRYELRVASLLPGAGQELVGPPATTTIEVPVPGAYTISWLGWPDRQVTATVTAPQWVRVPRLVLVAASGDWPLSPALGEVLAEAREVELAPDRPWRLRAPEPALARPYWLRCFAAGPVELRDPPRDQLRVG